MDVKLSEYLDSYGVKKSKSHRGKMEYNAQARRVAIYALKSLANEEFLLVYEKTEKGHSRKKVRVETVAPLLQLTRDSRRIEIIPNPVLVDHIDSYFILLPVDFFSIVQGKNPTRARFLEFLFYHAQMHRKKEVRYDKSSYEIRIQPEVIATWLRMDALLASRQAKKMRKQLDALYAFGVSTGYLESFASNQKGTRNRTVDVLKLNKKKFEEFKSLVLTVAKSSSSDRKV